MEIGNEISQKIRSAIKAKLLDLGAYVDDELPDYIMVMVANKKTKAQMTEDLNLFLGTHTDKFTTWLHSLLCKLQSITAEMIPGEKGDESEKLSKEKLLEDAETWAKATASEDKLTKVTPETSAEKPVATSSRIVPEKTQNSKQIIETVPEPAMEPEINLRPEHDEFEEEVQAEMEKQKKEAKTSQHRKRSSSSHTEKTTQLSDTIPTKERPSTHMSPKRRRHSKERHEKTTGKVSPRRRQSTKDTEQKSGKEERTSQGSSHQSKKKRPLTSSVGAVIRHDIYASDDEYDPLNPAVGNVASVVKVTERKSSIPPEMQPNKSLLLKAMEAAHKSVETATRQQTSKAIVKPTVRPKEQKEQNPERKSATRKDGEVQEKRSVSIRSRLGGRHKPSIAERLGEGKQIELVSRSSQESSRRIMSRTSGDSDEGVKSKRRKEQSSDEDSIKRSDYDREKTFPVEDTRDFKFSEQDSRQVEITVTRRIEKKKSRRHAHKRTEDTSDKLQSYMSGSDEEDLVSLLIEGTAESDVTGSSAGSIEVQSEDSRDAVKNETQPGSGDLNPKFVVTLDGVEPVPIDKDEVIEETHRVSPAKNVGMVKPQRPAAAVDPVLINLSEDNDEDHRSEVRPGTAPGAEVQKLQERCHFWPACKTGELCPYVHPSTQCLKFPNCHFGQKCLYMHPACKFDGQCTRPSCAYMHTVKRLALQPPTSIVLQPVRVPVYTPRPPVPIAVAPRVRNPMDLNCRFFPNCTNMDCTFRHPKPCRFGIGCLHKESCYFYHPSLPSKGQLKWSLQAGKPQAGVSQTSATYPVTTP